MQSAVLATAIPSVCPSLRSYVTLWYPIQTNEDRNMRSSLWGSKNILDFWYQQWLGDDDAFHLKFALKVTQPSKKRRLQPISAYNVSTVRASEKSSVIANRKSATRFPTSYRWSLYITPKSPMGGSKIKVVIFLWIKINLNRINSATEFFVWKLPATTL